MTKETTMPNPVFFAPIKEGDCLNDERRLLQWMATPPQVGDLLPLGFRTNRSWEVIAICSYIGDAGGLTIAHVNPVEIAVPDRAGWFATRLKISKPGASMRLHIKPDKSLHQIGCNFDGTLPAIGHLLTSFDVASHKTGHQPWGIDSFDTYVPVTPECTFAAIYLTHLEQVNLAEVPGAIDLSTAPSPA
jgi:hypothetical protein